MWPRQSEKYAATKLKEYQISVMVDNVIYNSETGVVTAGRVIICRQIVSAVWCLVAFH